MNQPEVVDQNVASEASAMQPPAHVKHRKLIAWVQRDVAPGAVSADTYSRPLKEITLYQTVRPYNALAPVTPAEGSLNGHYDYIGSY